MIEVVRKGKTELQLNLSGCGPKGNWVLSFNYAHGIADEHVGDLIEADVRQAFGAHNQEVRKLFAADLLHTPGFLHGKKRHRNWLRRKVDSILESWT